MTSLRGSRRVLRGGFMSEQDAAEALDRSLERLRRANGTGSTLTLAQLVDEYLAQHDAQPETIEKLRWLFGLIRSERELTGQLDDFQRWCDGAPGCTGIDDPRALPFHVFTTDVEWHALGTPDAQRAFQNRYGQPQSRQEEATSRQVVYDAERVILA